MSLYVYTVVSAIILSNIVISALGDNCTPFSAVQSDQCMNNYTYRHIRTSSLYECAWECRTSSVCESFNFDLRTRTCHLNSNSSVHFDLSPRPGMLFSDIKQWDKGEDCIGNGCVTDPFPSELHPTSYSMIGACATVTCPAFSKCLTSRTDSTQCVPEFQGCGPPPDVSNASVTYAGHFLGAEATYTCGQPDFQFNGAGSVCLANGEWTVINDTCERFQWRNPIIPFRESLPHREHHDLAIKLQAVPTKKTVFPINLRRGLDILLHLCCRLKDGLTALNAWLPRKSRFKFSKKRSWGKEFRPAFFPFAVNKTFLLKITLRHGVYQIMVDGIELASFPERAPGGQPEEITIKQDVRVDWIEITSELRQDEN